MVLPRITTDYHGNTTFACGNGKHVVMGPAVWYGNGIHGITITMVIYHGKKYGTVEKSRWFDNLWCFFERLPVGSVKPTGL